MAEPRVSNELAEIHAVEGMKHLRDTALDLLDARRRIAALEADAERWRWWMSGKERDIAGLLEGSLVGWNKAEWDAFVDEKIAAQRQKEGE